MVVIERTSTENSSDDQQTATCSLIPFGHDVVPVWQFNYIWNADFSSMRAVRSAVWRLHAEVEGLRGVLRAWQRDNETSHDEWDPHIDVDKLRDYIALQCSLLARVRRRGITQGTLVDNCLDRANLAEPAVISSLRLELSRQSKGVLRRLDAIVDRSRRTSLDGKLNLTLVGGQMTVEGDHYEFSGPASGVFGRQENVVANKFEQDAQSAKPLIDALVSELERLLPHVSEENAKELRDSRLQLMWADRDPGKLRAALKHAASIAVLAGEVGAPVIEAVRKVAAAIGL